MPKLSMSSPSWAFRRREIGPWASIAAHCAVLALLILAGRHAWHVRPVTQRGGGAATVLYWSNSVGTGLARAHVHGSEKTLPAQHAVHKAIARLPLEKTIDRTPATTREEASASPAGSESSHPTLAGAGNGTDDATPAFPVYSPTPPVDHSLLPKVEENVVVDVSVSSLGEVLDEKLVHGLGNGVDQVILDTVKNWKFHPATLNGNAIDSVAELVFPLSQRYRG